jgi:hypothetical protein
LLGQKVTLEKVGFYIADRSAHTRCLGIRQNLNLDVEFLTEWEIIKGADDEVDIEFIKRVEYELGEPFLWNALVADRRVYNGVLTKYKQAYKPRFTHEKMLGILTIGVKSVTEFVENIKPNIIVGGFTPVTFGEYLFYLYAKSKGIRYINLSPTKILNYVTFSEEIYREFLHIRETYADYINHGGDNTFLREGRRYLESKNEKYEGVVISTERFPYAQWCKDAVKWPFVFARYYLKRAYLDNQVRGYHWGYFLSRLYNPLKGKAVQMLLPYLSLEELGQFDYAYYPLHVEPEIALSVFGREYLNQIELVRNISRCIPVTWKLVVKDHPAGVGRRNMRYYRKLLEIPNVVLANHYVKSDHIIEKAKMVFTVSGFSGFEAVLRKKPVVTFGKTFYDILPDCMVQNVRLLQHLPTTVKDLLDAYRYCENEIVCLVAAIMKNSVPLNFYTQVLKKEGRVSFGQEELDEQTRVFVDYLAEWIGQPQSSTA